MVKIVQKLPNHIVSVGAGYTVASAIGASFGVPVFFGHNSDRSAVTGTNIANSFTWLFPQFNGSYNGTYTKITPLGTMASLINGYASGYIIEVTAGNYLGSAHIQYQFSQDVSAIQSGTITLTMTTRAPDAVSWPGIGDATGNIQAIAGTSGYSLIIGLPNGASAIYSLKLFHDVSTPVEQKFAFPLFGYDIRSLNWSDNASLMSGDTVLSFVGFWDDNTFTTYKRYLISWLPSNDPTDAISQELQLSDMADNLIFLTQNAPPAGLDTPIKALKVSGSKWGWFLSFDYMEGATRVRHYYQVDPTFSFYREIFFQGTDDIATRMLATPVGTLSVQQDDGGSLIIIGNDSVTGQRILPSSSVEQPDWPAQPGDPTLRAWTVSLDGHDFYVLRLGTNKTLIFDQTTGTWPNWGSADSELWRVLYGANWLGAGNYAASYGSNIIAGDDTEGLLWILDPTQGYDDGVEPGDPLSFFTRIVMGQIALRGRQFVPCYSADLTTDNDPPAYEDAPIKLETSDDAGKTWTDHGDILITSDALARPQITLWESLGQMASPGRLFRITDDGAIGTVFSLDVNDGG